MRKKDNVQKVGHHTRPTVLEFNEITTDIPVIHSVQLERPRGAYSQMRYDGITYGYTPPRSPSE